MLLYKFIKSLLPSIDKASVLESLRLTVAELDNTCLPNYLQVSEYLKTSKPKSAEVSALSTKFYKNFDSQHSAKQATFVGEINRRLSMVRDNVSYVKEQSENLFESTIITDAMTAKKAVLIRASEAFTFISRFSLDLLNYVLAKEALQTGGEVSSEIDNYPALNKFVENNIVKFARLLSDYGIPRESFSKIINEVPDIILNSKTVDAVQGVYNKNSGIEPFQFGHLSGFTGNPIYHIRMLFAEWQHDAYNADKDKKQLLELRLLHLKMLKEKDNNPKIEQEIVYLQGRIDKLEYRLRKVEEELKESD